MNITRDFESFLKYQYAITNNWIHVSFVEKIENKYYSEPNSKIVESFDRDEVTEWCQERCKKGWVVAGGSALFEDDKDAMLFRLRFNNYE